MIVKVKSSPFTRVSLLSIFNKSVIHESVTLGDRESAVMKITLIVVPEKESYGVTVIGYKN